MVSIGADQKASTVIYFRQGITDQQVEDFNLSVPIGGPRRPGT
jgi:hypothetical protein